ncbi:MAG: hypothetical protein ACE366_03000 [Bradymonadia bacterium]
MRFVECARVALCLALVAGCDDGNDTTEPSQMAPDADLLSPADRTPSSDEPAPNREPTPYVPDIDDEAIPAALEDEALADALTEYVPAVLTLDLSSVPERLAGLIDLTAPECPGGQQYETEEGYVIVAENECTHSSGVRFEGYLRLAMLDYTGDEGQRVTGFNIESGSVRIDTPDGRSFEAGGYLDVRHERQSDGEVWGTYTQGSVRFDDETAGDNLWLSGAMSGRIERYIYRHESGEMVMGASVATAIEVGPDGGAISAISIDDLELNTWLCAEEPIGTLSVREAEGVWHDVHYDGFDPEEEAPLACDGCGRHLVGGMSDDQLCEGEQWLQAIRASLPE